MGGIKVHSLDVKTVEITNQDKFTSPAQPYFPKKNQGKPPQHKDVLIPLEPAPMLVVQLPAPINNLKPTVTEPDTCSGPYAPSHVENNQTYSPTHQAPSAEGNRPTNDDTDVSVPSPRRSQRTSKAPRKYVPETGLWN